MCGLLLIALAFAMLVKTLVPPEGTRTVEGVIVRTEGPPGATRNVVDYVVDGTTYQAWSPHGSGCKGGGCNGTATTVRYHIANPTQAEVFGAGVGGTVFGLLVLGAGGIGLVWLGAWGIALARRPTP